MNADGRHQRQLTHLNRVQFYGELDWAPDGQTIVIKAFASAVGGSTELWLVNASTGKVTQLTHTVLGEAGPSWSPNGRWIAFFSEGRGRAPTGSGGSHPRRNGWCSSRPRSPGGDLPSWSPDSRRIAFTLGGRLAIMDADGSHRHTLRLFATQPHWSADGRWIVFTARRRPVQGPPRRQRPHPADAPRQAGRERPARLVSWTARRLRAPRALQRTPCEVARRRLHCAVDPEGELERRELREPPQSASTSSKGRCQGAPSRSDCCACVSSWPSTKIQIPRIPGLAVRQRSRARHACEGSATSRGS